MKIISISDLHGFLPKIPECDLLLIGGDVCPTCNHENLFQAQWLNSHFKMWLDSLPAKEIVATPGNHDHVFEKAHHLLIREIQELFLIDNMVEKFGLKIYGIPWTRTFFDWAFMLEESDLDKKYNKIPNCDIILSHGPPYGYGDLCKKYKGTGMINVGSKAYLNKIREIQPVIATAGHIHSGYGVYKEGSTTILHSSLVNERYKLVNCPLEIDI